MTKSHAQSIPESVRPLPLVRSRLVLVAQQDRLLFEGVTAKEEKVAFWITRRLALHIFQRLRAEMEEHSPAGRSPAAWRDEALALEHAAILKAEQGKKAVKPWDGAVAPRLLAKVGIKSMEGRSSLAFVGVGNQHAATIQFGNAQMHRFAALLALRIQQARWDLGMDLAWLARPAAASRPAAPKKAN